MYNLQHSHLLAIDRASGRISLAQKLDYEAVREVGVRLVAGDVLGDDLVQDLRGGNHVQQAGA